MDALENFVKLQLLREGFSYAELDSLGHYRDGFVAGNTLMVFAPEPNPSVERAREWLEQAYRDLPKGVGMLVILAVFEGRVPDEFRGYVKKARKVSFLGRGCMLVAIDSEEKKLLGQWTGFSAAIGRALAGYDPQKAPDEAVFAEERDKIRHETEAVMGELLQISPHVTHALVGMCVAIFALMAATGGTETDWNLFRYGSNYPPLNKAGQVWRMASACFIHIGWLHLLVNMYSLLAVGPSLERLLGNRGFAFLYAFSGLTGGLASTLFRSAGLAAGASGAIFGLFGAGLYIDYFCKDQLPGALRRHLVGGLAPTILYNLLYGFSNSGIDNSAHVGGLLGGIAVAAVLGKLGLKRVRENQVPTAPMVALSALLPLGLLWALVQAFTYPTLESYPRRLVQPLGVAYQLQLPLVDQPEKLEGGRIGYVGPGHLWVLPSAPLAEGETRYDFRKEAHRTEFLKAAQMEQKATTEVVEVRGRTWLLIRLAIEEDKVNLMAATVEKGQLYTPMLLTLKEDEAGVKAALLKVLETVEPR